MAIVVDFDPLRHFGQLEKIGDFAQRTRFGSAFGKTALQRLHRVALRLAHQPAPRAALWNANLDPVASRGAQRLLDQLALRQFAVD